MVDIVDRVIMIQERATWQEMASHARDVI